MLQSWHEERRYQYFQAFYYNPVISINENKLQPFKMNEIESAAAGPATKSRFPPTGWQSAF